MARAQVADLPVNIDSSPQNIKSYGFTTSNGDYLLAVWSDGVAVENDPGVNSTLTLPNFSSDEVIGIDPLFGFQQEIMPDHAGGSLTIHDFLLKDYPIILRFILSTTP
jgi:hypothetical protein